MKKRLLYLVLGLVLIPSSSPPANGEGCSKTDSICHHFWTGLDSIFIGQVVSVSPLSESFIEGRTSRGHDNLKRLVKVDFAVEKSYGKYAEKRIEIEVLGSDDQRPIEFQVGAHYLVFAEQRVRSDRRLWVYPCGPTKLVTDASADIAFLESVYRLNPAADILNYRDERVIHVGILQGRALSLPKPAYPGWAKAAHASGSILVLVLLDERGSVIRVKSVCGNPLLMEAAEAAAWQAKFSPTKVIEKTVKVSTLIAYNFISN
jgi:hypothetical protein